MTDTNASRRSGGLNQTIRKPPVPCLGASRAASDATQNRLQGSGVISNCLRGCKEITASKNSKQVKMAGVNEEPRLYCLSLIAARPPAPTRPQTPCSKKLATPYNLAAVPGVRSRCSS